jgi:hypothetical protein
MSEFRKLSEYSDGEENKTSQIYITQSGNSKYMVLLYEAQTDYNEAMFFDNEDDAEDCAEDWVMIK